MEESESAGRGLYAHEGAANRGTVREGAVVRGRGGGKGGGEERL